MDFSIVEFDKKSIPAGGYIRWLKMCLCTVPKTHFSVARLLCQKHTCGITHTFHNTRRYTHLTILSLRSMYSRNSPIYCSQFPSSVNGTGKLIWTQYIKQTIHTLRQFFQSFLLTEGGLLKNLRKLKNLETWNLETWKLKSTSPQAGLRAVLLTRIHLLLQIGELFFVPS